MKPILATTAALGVGLGFAAAEYYSIRPGANWLDMQWVFLAALPYNWSMLRLTGESSFSNDSAAQVAAAALVDVALAFLIGLAVETGVRAAWRAFRRVRGRA